MSHVLMVDDDASFTEATCSILHLLGEQVSVAASIAQAKELLAHQRFDIFLLDIMLPDGSGIELLPQLRQQQRPRHIAFITGHAAIKNTINSVAGPDVSYLLKPINLEALKALLEKARQAVADTAPDSSLPARHFSVLVGESAPMLELYTLIERVARSQANVLIQGESGTGKELVAAAIHQAASCTGPFIAANCGAMAKDLIASELFGHEKGAFTGAVTRKIGLFERANGGTLFLDEVTEMPLEMQPNLLRVLETGTFTRVGGQQEISTNCRVISATNRSSEALASGQFLREDIYFRLAVFPLRLPSLAQRKTDIALLAENFLHGLNLEQGTALKLRDQDQLRLQQYDWPGNVRELRHALHRAFIMTEPGATFLQIPQDLGSPFTRDTGKTQPALRAGKTIQEMERELIEVTLQQVSHDKPRAAEMLGISLKTLYNRLNQYGVSLSDAQ